MDLNILSILVFVNWVSDNPVHGFRTPEPPLKFVPLFLCPLIIVRYLYVYMKLLDIILEDGELNESKT